MLELFSNNAEGVLAQSSGLGSTLVLAARGKFHPLDEGGFQRATITNADTPNQVEIVKILSWAGATATVERDVEGGSGGTGYDWPAGSKVSARVTAGMLERAPQTTHWYSVGGDSNVVEFGVSPQSGLSPKTLSVRNPFSIRAVQSLPIDAANTAPTGMASMPRAIETVARSLVVSLSSPQAHNPATGYYPGDIVVPAVSDGYQYILLGDSSVNPYHVGGAVGAVTFSGDGYTQIVAHNSESEVAGLWSPVQTPARIEGPVHDVVSEVGFVTTVAEATTAAYISVGTTADETAYINNLAVPLTAGGALRAPIPAGIQNGNDLVFKVVTEATGGRLHGFFYARGFDVNL